MTKAVFTGGMSSLADVERVLEFAEQARARGQLSCGGIGPAGGGERLGEAWRRCGDGQAPAGRKFVGGHFGRAEDMASLEEILERLRTRASDFGRGAGSVLNGPY